jgi:membrane-anchored glycerophosphoryl diester phosphodiesterase (GDPDase)
MRYPRNRVNSIPPTMFQSSNENLKSSDLPLLLSVMTLCFITPYWAAREALVFPLTVLGVPEAPRRSWNLTRRNGWRLFLTLLVAALLPVSVAFVAVAALGLGIQTPSLFDVTGEWPALAGSLLLMASSYASFALEASVLSNAALQLGDTTRFLRRSGALTNLRPPHAE